MEFTVPPPAAIFTTPCYTHRTICQIRICFWLIMNMQKDGIIADLGSLFQHIDQLWLPGMLYCGGRLTVRLLLLPWLSPTQFCQKLYCSIKGEGNLLGVPLGSSTRWAQQSIQFIKWVCTGLSLGDFPVKSGCIIIAGQYHQPWSGSYWYSAPAHCGQKELFMKPTNGNQSKGHVGVMEAGNPVTWLWAIMVIFGEVMQCLKAWEGYSCNVCPWVRLLPI